MQSVTYKDTDFLKLFHDMPLENKLREALKTATIWKIDVYKEPKKVEIYLKTTEFIPINYFIELEKAIALKFNLEGVIIKPKFELGLEFVDFLNKYWNELLALIYKKLATSRAIIPGSTWELEGNKLHIKLISKGAEILKAQKCNLLLERILEELFSFKVFVYIRDADFDEAKRSKYIESKERAENEIVNSIQSFNEVATKDSLEKKVTDTISKLPPIKEIKNESNTKQPSDLILGKIFNDQTVPIKEVNLESGRIAIFGEIIKIEIRETRNGKHLVVFDMTDFTGSITAKFFATSEKLEIINENIKQGSVIKLRGDAQYDKYSKECTVFANDIVMSKKNIIMDDAKEKRVELHMHSQMSALDGVNSIKDLIKRAADWGHKAIAVTDHGVVQAFPEAYETGKKNNIKVLLGVESYLLDDNIPTIVGGETRDFDSTYVVFDIETTGFTPGNDKITEIGAVKIVNGKIIEEFGNLVNPERQIPAKIVELTGITNEMVKNAPTIDGILKKFLDFSGDAVLVAHNASFDTGFIKYNARKLNIEVNNPILDTLQLARKLFPDLKKHKLNLVAKHLGIDMENHHRAVDDAKATGEILIKCFDILREKGLNTLSDLEKFFEGNNDFTKGNIYHAIILVKDYIGLKNLYKIISETHLNYFFKKPRLPKKLLTKYREGLLIGSACEAGELYSAILDKKSEEEIEKIAKFYDYLEIQPLGNNQFLIEKEKVKDKKELEDINMKIVKLGDELDKPVVATCDVHFLDPRDEVFRRILMAGQGFSDADNQAPLYLRTTDQMIDEFRYLGKEKAYEVVVTNTNKIADMCESIMPIPDGTFPPKIKGSDEEIKHLAESKAKKIYGNILPEIVDKRLEKELNSIIKNGFSVMYIIAQKLVWKSLNDGYLVGSRGSVGSSFVANMIGITEVNSLPPHYICTKCKQSEFIADGSVGCGFDLPDKDCPTCGKLYKKDGYDIPFETFLGFDGDKEPDIDLNFSGEYQAKAHKYTEELFGEGKVFKAGTIGTIAEKTAYGYVKNYLDEKGVVANNAEINRLILGCTGVKRTSGQHPGGLMIVPEDKDIYEFCPIQRPADDVESKIITTHFDYHSISGRLLKLDILGHDDPTVIKMLEDLTGVDAKTIIIGEKKTMELFSSTKSLGVKPEDINSEVGTFAVPEFGTKFVRQMLVDTKPTTFSELIRISGLSHGTDVWINNAQELVRSNIATLPEVICTRDDIMVYLIYAGLPPKTAFKIMEDVRKGKGIKEECDQIMKEYNVSNWYIESCKKIKYMFPKAHAAAYVMMAFRIAWFKVYYPEAFYVTYFTVRADEFDAELMAQGQEKVRRTIREYEQKGNEMTQKEKNVLTILEVSNEMYARGIKFLPVDLYESDAFKFQIIENGIRPPLNALQGLGTNAAQNIVEARKNGKFFSVDDLRIRAKVSKTVIEILQRSGCLQGMQESNQLSIFNM